MAEVSTSVSLMFNITASLPLMFITSTEGCIYTFFIRLISFIGLIYMSVVYPQKLLLDDFLTVDDEDTLLCALHATTAQVIDNGLAGILGGNTLDSGLGAEVED